MALCLPLIFGFPTKFKQDAPEAGRMCPRCHNAAVVGGDQRTWFEFFWIPLIPFKKHHVWVCTICQWEMRKGDGYDPQPLSVYNQANIHPGGGGGGYHGQRPPPPNQGNGR